MASRCAVVPRRRKLSRKSSMDGAGPDRQTLGQIIFHPEASGRWGIGDQRTTTCTGGVSLAARRRGKRTAGAGAPGTPARIALFPSAGIALFPSAGLSLRSGAPAPRYCADAVWHCGARARMGGGHDTQEGYVRAVRSRAAGEQPDQGPPPLPPRVARKPDSAAACCTHEGAEKREHRAEKANHRSRRAQHRALPYGVVCPIHLLRGAYDCRSTGHDCPSHPASADQPDARPLPTFFDPCPPLSLSSSKQVRSGVVVNTAAVRVMARGRRARACVRARALVPDCCCPWPADGDIQPAGRQNVGSADGTSHHR